MFVLVSGKDLSSISALFFRDQGGNIEIYKKEIRFL